MSWGCPPPLSPIPKTNTPNTNLTLPRRVLVLARVDMFVINTNPYSKIFFPQCSLNFFYLALRVSKIIVLVTSLSLFNVHRSWMFTARCESFKVLVLANPGCIHKDCPVDGRFGHGRFGLGRFALGCFGPGCFSHRRFSQAIFKGGRFGQIQIFRRFHQIMNH